MTKKVIPLLIIVIVTGIMAFLLWPKTPDKQSPSEPLFFSYSMDRQDYKIEKKGVPRDTENLKIYGATVSHHLFSANEINKLFNILGSNDFETIVILGTNHYNPASFLKTSNIGYKTPWGKVSIDLQTTDQLFKETSLVVDNKIFESEHSISSIVPYIKYYFPKAKMVPIAVGKMAKEIDIENFVLSLKNNLPEKSLVIASVDFSHHLNNNSSIFHDKKSISAIENFDFENINKLEIDSPNSIKILLKYLDSIGARKMTYWNTNSAKISKSKNSNDVTSYLFSYWTPGEKPDGNLISILSFGDAMFGRNVGISIENGKDPFEFIKGAEGNFLKGVDLISLNLEGPITDNKNCQTKAYTFSFATTTAKMLAKNNISVVNLANNHIFDCFGKGIADTEKYLASSSISYFGGTNLYTTKEIGNQKVAFVGIDLTINPELQEKYLYLIKKLKLEENLVIVNIHWGIEYAKKPSKDQISVGRQIIDAGADAIIGHHPHVIQPLEIYKNKLIFYSLGNFIFDQIGYEENRGVGTGLIFENGKISEAYIFPYQIVKHQPQLLSPEESEKFCADFLNLPQISTTTSCSFSI